MQTKRHTFQHTKLLICRIQNLPPNRFTELGGGASSGKILELGWGASSGKILEPGEFMEIQELGRVQGKSLNWRRRVLQYPWKINELEGVRASSGKIPELDGGRDQGRSLNVGGGSSGKIPELGVGVRVHGLLPRVGPIRPWVT
jgi:hypothetical protein